MTGAVLGDDLLLLAVQPDDAAAGVRHPQGPVGFSEDAFRALEIVADVAEGVCVDAKVQNRVGPHGLGSPHQAASDRAALGLLSGTAALYHPVRLIIDCVRGPAVSGSES